jgi:hypothetical protein
MCIASPVFVRFILPPSRLFCEVFLAWVVRSIFRRLIIFCVGCQASAVRPAASAVLPRSTQHCRRNVVSMSCFLFDLGVMSAGMCWFRLVGVFRASVCGWLRPKGDLVQYLIVDSMEFRSCDSASPFGSPFGVWFLDIWFHNLFSRIPQEGRAEAPPL